MSAYRKTGLVITLMLVASAAQAQSITKQGDAQFQMADAAKARRATVLDYVVPYIPLIGIIWREKPQSPDLTQAAPVPPAQTPPPPRKKKPVGKKRAAPQPAAATLSAPQDKPSPATVDALTRCLTGFAAREVSRGSQANGDQLMAEATDRDCEIEFHGLAKSITRAGDKAKARQMLEIRIRETLSPAVETAMADAKAIPQ